MGQDRYDAIVVGARCAGSPTAMLLARKGYEVLVVDRAKFPSDTLSTHILHPPAVAGAAAMGSARPTGRDGVPTDRHVLVRLRAVHARGCAGHRGHSGRVLPAPHRARQAAGRRRVGGRRRGP